MAIVVERAAPRHAYDIDELLRTCFARPAEAMLVKQLAMDGDLVLALIARDEESDAVAGLVALSKMHVAIGGDPAPAVALAPLAGMPDYRRPGVAAALVPAACAPMRDAGALLLFVPGDPRYSRRVRFSAVKAEAESQEPR